MFLYKISIMEKLSLAVLIFVIGFCIGFFIAKYMLHKAYVDNLWTAISYAMNVRKTDTFRDQNKKETVDNLLKSINDSYAQKQYNKAVQQLNELQQKYSTLAGDLKFEQLMKKIR